MKRRRFLNGLLRAAGAALGGLLAYPVVRYIVPPRVPEARTRRVTAAREDEVPRDDFKIFPIGGAPGILIHMEDGEYRAFSAVCTHLGCTVQYRQDRKDIWCACHNGVYDLEGRNVSGPPPRPLERYAVHLDQGELLVERQA